MRAGLGRELGQDVITFYVKPDYLQAFTHRSCSLRTTHGTHQEKTHPIVMPLKTLLPRLCPSHLAGGLQIWPRVAIYSLIRSTGRNTGPAPERAGLHPFLSQTSRKAEESFSNLIADEGGSL